MALYNNGYRLGNSPFKRSLGALSTIYNGGGSSFNHTMPTSAMRASYWLYGKYSAYPKGGGHPDCWMLPQVGGAMSCKTACVGGGSLTVSMAAGVGIAGTAAGVCTLSGELTGLAWVEGSAQGGSNVSATLTGYGFIAGLSAGSAQADGSIFAAVAIQGTAAGSSEAVGTGYLALSMTGTASGSSTAEGSLAALLPISGTASGSSSASATITGGYFAEGLAAGTSTVTGALPIGYGWMSGTLIGSGGLTADPSALGFMNGSTDISTGELNADSIAAAVWSYER